MRLQAALQEGIQVLRGAGVDEARLDAELLAGHALGLSRAAVVAHPDRELTPKELTRFRDLLARRAAREPLPYIVGTREFYGLELAVDSRVLIPRPETELLVENALRWARQAARPLVIADVGAGSGAIAVALAIHLPDAVIYAVDSSSDALAVTAENAKRHRVADRVQCLTGDLLAALPAPVDLVVANLPYVAEAEWPALPPEVREWEPRRALDGGPDGLALIRRLLAQAGPFLRPPAALLLEIGAGQGADGVALARHYFPGADVRVIPDYAGLDRLVGVYL
jgi:release factor glutamine methyltransferase